MRSGERQERRRPRRLRSLRRWLLRLAAVALALLAAAGGLAWWRWRAPLPRDRGRLEVSGPGEPLEISRDALGIPRVTAASERDAAFATGFVHGQDRLFQIDLLRRLAAGRLSELFGPVALPADRRARRRDPRARAQADWESLSGPGRDLLEAYAAGVNGAAAAATALPLEYAFLRAAFEPWTALDSLLAVQAMQERLVLSSRELTRHRLAEQVGAAAATWLLDGRLIGDAVVLPEGDGAAARAAAEAGWERTRDLLAREAGLLGLSWERPAAPSAAASVRPAGAEPGGGLPVRRAAGDVILGSNAWAVAGERSASGAPLLANDIHLPLETPGPFYLASLTWPGVRVSGATVPGFPGVVIGRNEHLAWAVTILTADLVDYVAIRVDPEHPDRYLTAGAEGGSLAFGRRQERIAVAGGDAVVETVLETIHGPVVDRDWRPGLMLARAALPFRPAGELEAVRGYARARTLEEFRTASRGHGLPGENLVVATVDGRIGYVAAVAVPRRTGSGLLPAPGWLPEPVYDGWLAPGPETWSGDPAAGLVVSANNRVQPGVAGEEWNGSWIRADRAARAGDLLRRRPRHDGDSFRQMQGDAWSRQADMVMSGLRRAATAGDWNPPGEGDAGRAWALLASWDMIYDDGPGPGLFSLFHRRLLEAVFGDDVGDLAAAGSDAGLLKLLAPERFVDAGLPGVDPASWWDDGRTVAIEGMGEVVSGALAAAWRDLEKRAPGGPAAWDWPALHRARFIHPLGRQAVLAPLFNGPDLGLAGEGGCLLAAASRAPGFDVFAIPALRLVADLGPAGGLRMVSPIGQSGIPASVHYDDQADLWQRLGDHEVHLPPPDPLPALTLVPAP